MKRSASQSGIDDEPNIKKLHVVSAVAPVGESCKNETNLKLPSGWSHIDCPFPKFGPPKEVGHLSITADDTIVTDSRCLAQYLGIERVKKDSKITQQTKTDEATVKFDLSIGFEDWTKDCEPEKNQDDFGFLRWLLKKREEDSTFQLADFVCWRGLLTIVACTQYEQQKDWRIAAIKRGDTIFLWNFKTEAEMSQIANIPDNQYKSIYGGHIFEKYITDYPDKEDIPGLRKEKFATVVSSRLKEHTLLYAGETDGYEVLPNGERQYVEMKTTRLVQHPKHAYTQHRYKHPKWWTQSFLVNIPKLIIGERDTNDFITRIKEYSLYELREVSKSAAEKNKWRGTIWKPNISFEFVYKFLTHVKEQVNGTKEDRVFVFYYNPSSQCQITCHSFDNSHPFYFIPSWFKI